MKPAIVSRGYSGTAGRGPLLVCAGDGPLCEPADCGDEPYLLALSLPGTIVVVGHDLTNIEHGYGGPQAAEVLYSPEDLVADLGPLEIVKAEKVERPYESEEGNFTAIDALVVARRP